MKLLIDTRIWSLALKYPIKSHHSQLPVHRRHADWKIKMLRGAESQKLGVGSFSNFSALVGPQEGERCRKRLLAE